MSELEAALGHDHAPVPERIEGRVDAEPDPQQAYQRLLQRLCDASVRKRFEAYRDIDWDHPSMRIDPEDPRWELPVSHPLGATRWYRAQPGGTRARIGLHMAASFCYLGRVFEGFLCRGLLRFAARLPHDSLEYRYAYHEVIEEGQHSLMFQEFVKRAGLPVPQVTPEFMQAAGQVAEFGETFPELLFIYALGGEEPIDHAQRSALARGHKPHPVSDRMSRIHITEEARHIAFARAYLRLNVPKLSPEKRDEMSLTVPVILGTMARMMLEPPQHIIDVYGIPEQVMQEAFVDSALHRERVVGSMVDLRELCEELGLMPAAARQLWQDAGLL